MLNEDSARKAIAVLIQDGFKIQNIQFAEEHFGNFLVELMNRDDLRIRFVNDRGQLSCEVGRGSDWMLASDVLAVFGKSFQYVQTNDQYQTMEEMAKAVHCDLEHFRKAMNGKNFGKTKRKVEKIQQNRAEELIRGFQ